MKSSSKILILAIFLVFICCVSAASAAENDNVTASGDELAVEEIAADDVVDEQDTLASSEVNVNVENNELLTAESSKTIYVGHHNTTEGGDGSYDNPFTTFKAACDDVNGEDNVTIYVFGGEYKLGEGMVSGLTTGTASPLTFNTSNLNIIGINGSVIIKNFNTVKKNGYAEAFSLTSTSGNFTFSNLIFDATNSVAIFLNEDDPYAQKTTYFFPFFGQANLGIFNNCSFKGFGSDRIAETLNYNSKFINCYLEWNKNYLFKRISNINLSFENCIFNCGSGVMLSLYFHNSCNVSMINMWFGKNSLSFSMPDQSNFFPDVVVSNVISVTRYAIFNVTQNYLGNDEYEIMGKLIWNGTDDQDGMENFQPMTVTLLSENGGEIASNVPLVNGNFNTTYKNSASNHKITAILHNQDIDLVFTTVNITANPVSIYYGEDQNITIAFSQEINSTVSITINNKTYNVKVNESNSLTYTIEDILKEGNYTVGIVLNDGAAKLYGATSTNFTVSKVSNYAFDPVIPSEAKVGDDVLITVELPSDVNGTVTVYVNNKPFTKEASANTEITINGLVAGDNNIIVEYSGNDKYVNKSTAPTVITAEKESVYEFDVVLPTGVKVGDDTNITIELPSDVNGTATVYVGNQDGVVVPVNSASTVVPVSGLVAGNNTIKVVFSDNKYAEKTVTKNLTVEKVPVEIKNNTIVVNTPTGSAAPTVSFNLPNATGNLTVTVKGKTYTKELVNGTATVTITDLPAGTYDATVTYSGDDKFDSITTTTKITVNEAKKQEQKTDSKTKKVTKVATKIVAKNKKFKAKTKVKKYTITLKAGKKPVKKVQVTIKIGKKTYKAKTNNKGKATFKIKKLTKKAKYKATIKFKGNKNYKATSKKVKITIK